MTTADPGTTIDLDTGRGVARWSSLSTYVFLAVQSRAKLPAAVDLAIDVLEQVDATYSRFRPDSELRRLATGTGPQRVSPLLAGAVRVALDAAEQTEGLVDPTLGEQLLAAGYDRTFASVPAASADPAQVLTRTCTWSDVHLHGDHLALPVGCQLDLGATGKAFAADLIATMIADDLATPTLLSLGGDLRAITPEDSDHSWPVDLAPTAVDLDDSPTASITVRSAGVATSSIGIRRWRRAGVVHHHLLDPRTGRSAEGPWRSVSVVADHACAANTLSTAAMVLGDAAYDWLLERDASALLIDHAGTPTRTPSWSRHVHELGKTP